MALRSTLFLFFFFFFCMSQGLCEEKMGETQVNHLVKGNNRRLLTLVDCSGLCKVRCSLHSRPNVCLRACGTCCMRCQCVPPGTYGNREKCGTCYTEMRTHDNKYKCP